MAPCSCCSSLTSIRLVEALNCFTLTKSLCSKDVFDGVLLKSSFPHPGKFLSPAFFIFSLADAAQSVSFSE